MPVLTIPDLSLFLLALLVVAAPAVLFLREYAPGLPLTEAALLGTTAGLAVHVAALNYFPFVSGWWLTIGIAVTWLAATAVLWTLRSRLGTPDSPAPDTGYEWLLIGVLVAQFALLLLPARENPLPFGNDAVYHVAISDKLIRAGTIPDDFLPYDPVAPTYTLGSHLLIAFGSLQTSLPVHRLYQFVLPLCLVLMTGLLSHLGRVAFSPQAGFFAAFVYAFLTNWGSIDLLRWGSVPNAAGMVCFVAAVRCLIAPVGPVPVLLPALFVGAMAATHHLSALIFAIVCVAWGVRHLRRHGLKAPLLKRMAGAWAFGIALVLPGVWSLAAEVLRSLRSSEEAALDAGVPYLNVVEPLIPIWELPLKLGVVMVGLAAVGLWRVRRDRAADPVRTEILVWTATMAAAFAILDWPVRWVIDAIWRRDLAILTPSRFLTDLSYPLCLLAGVGLASLWRTSRKTALVIAAAAPCYALVVVWPLTVPQIPPAEIEGLRWFGRSAPENSLLLQAPPWTTYLSGREGDVMVLREERLSPYTERKRKLVDQGTRAINAWMTAHNRPVYIWETRDLSVLDLERVWQGDGAYIYRFRGP
jgi:hypothetical protein